METKETMEWRIRESSYGYVAERGLQHSGGVHVTGIIGTTMPVFIVYESARFDTKKQAQAYIRRRQKH